MITEKPSEPGEAPELSLIVRGSLVALAAWFSVAAQFLFSLF